MLEWMGLNFYYYDGLQTKRSAGMIKEQFSKKTFLYKLRSRVDSGYTLYNVILRIARNFLETRENIKISTHPFYHINLD